MKYADILFNIQNRLQLNSFGHFLNSKIYREQENVLRKIGVEVAGNNEEEKIKMLREIYSNLVKFDEDFQIIRYDYKSVAELDLEEFYKNIDDGTKNGFYSFICDVEAYVISIKNK